MSGRVGSRRVWSILLAAVFSASVLSVAFEGAALVALLIMLAGVTVAGAVLVKPERAVLIFLLALPAYLMSLVILYGVLGAPAPAVRLAQSWKEMLVLTALVGVALRAAVGRLDLTTSWFDGIVALYLLMNLIYVAFPVGNSDVVARLAAVRANSSFAALYLLGRTASPAAFNRRLVVRITVALALALIGAVVLEMLLLPSDWPLRLGYTRLLIDFYGGVAIHSPDELPWTFWTAGKVFRRPSAFFANPLDMAAGCLVLVGGTFSLYLAAAARRKRHLGWLLLTAVLALIIFVSLARMAIASLPVVLAGVAFAFGRRGLAVAVLLGVIAMGVLAILVSGPLVQDYVRATLLWEDASSIGHLLEWRTALEALASGPLGSGLGTSGAVGARTDVAIGGENQYLIVAVQLGWAGLLTFAAVTFGGVWQAAKAFGRTRDPVFGIGLAAMIAVMLLGMTAEIGTYLFVSYCAWWFVGYAVCDNLRSGVFDPHREAGRAGSLQDMAVGPRTVLGTQ